MYYKHRLIVQTICCLFVFLFIYAATSKIIEFEKFQSQIAQSPLLSKYTKAVGIGIPLLEIILSVLLAFRVTQLVALYASYSLMIMFSTYIIVITKFSDYVPCSCGGILEKMSWNQHLKFNLVFVLLGIVGIFLYRGDKRGHV